MDSELVFGSKRATADIKDNDVKLRTDLLVVPEHKNVKGRGPPKDLLLMRRIKQHGWILVALGLYPQEIFESADVPVNEVNKQHWFRPWHEKIQADVLCVKHVVDPKSIVANYQREVLLARLISKRTTTSSSKGHESRTVALANGNGFMVEHLEANPLGYGIRGMHSAMLCFTRVIGQTDTDATMPDADDQAPQSGLDRLFYDIKLSEDEPSPFVFDVKTGEEVRVLYTKGLGMHPLVEVPTYSQSEPESTDSSQPTTGDDAMDDDDLHQPRDFFVSEGKVYRCHRLFIASQLEPEIHAPDPSSFGIFNTNIASKPGSISPGALCLFRSSQHFVSMSKDLLGDDVLSTDTAALLEANALLVRLLRHSTEAHSALVGTESQQTLETIKIRRALRFVVQEMQMSPWNRTKCYWYLFKQIGCNPNPYPVGVTMRVKGIGDPSGRNELVSYLPRVSCKESPGLPSPNVNWFKDENDRLQNEDDPDVNCSEDEEDTEAIQAQEPNSRKKRGEFSKKKSVPVSGNKLLDARLLKVPVIRNYLYRLPVPIPSDYECKRWCGVWILQKIASSHKGPTILNGELMNYARASLRAQEVRAMQVARDDAKNRKEMEKESFFKAFRALANSTWSNFQAVARSFKSRYVALPRSSSKGMHSSFATTASPGGTADAIDDIDDEWCENLTMDLLNNGRESKRTKRDVSDSSGVTAGGTEEVIDIGLMFQEMETKLQRERLFEGWAADRQSERMSPPVWYIKKRTVLTCTAEKEFHTPRIKVVYYLFRSGRVRYVESVSSLNGADIDFHDANDSMQMIEELPEILIVEL